MKIWAKTSEFSEGKFLVVRRDGSIPCWPTLWQETHNVKKVRTVP
jgi:hypothetical protein